MECVTGHFLTILVLSLCVGLNCDLVENDPRVYLILNGGKDNFDSEIILMNKIFSSDHDLTTLGDLKKFSRLKQIRDELNKGQSLNEQPNNLPKDDRKFSKYLDQVLEFDQLYLKLADNNIEPPNLGEKYEAIWQTAIHESGSIERFFDSLSSSLVSEQADDEARLLNYIIFLVKRNLKMAINHIGHHFDVTTSTVSDEYEREFDLKINPDQDATQLTDLDLAKQAAVIDLMSDDPISDLIDFLHSQLKIVNTKDNRDLFKYEMDYMRDLCDTIIMEYGPIFFLFNLARVSNMFVLEGLKLEPGKLNRFMKLNEYTRICAQYLEMNFSSRFEAYHKASSLPLESN